VRTTVDLPQTLLSRAKQLAAERHTSLSAVVSEALGAYIGKARRSAADQPFELIVRGRPGARFPSPAEIAAVGDEEDVAALRVPGVLRRAPP
jgi:hypothetical protein